MAKPYLDPYHILGLEQTATPAEIKKAYFQLVREHPPERDAENFKRIRAAYERVRDPEKRDETNMRLLNRWTASPRKRRPPEPDVSLHQEDILIAARTLTDMERKDWREFYRKIKW